MILRLQLGFDVTHWILCLYLRFDVALHFEAQNVHHIYAYPIIRMLFNMSKNGKT